MDCSCKSAICRGRIRDFKYLPAVRQLYYLNRCAVGDFCVESTRELIMVDGF